MVCYNLIFVVLLVSIKFVNGRKRESYTIEAIGYANSNY